MTRHRNRPIDQARRLRRDSTEAEKLLWSRLRDRAVTGCKFRRQHAIGRYVVDFVCLEQALVIEVDGGQHAIDAERDRERTEWLEGRGFRVLRFWNNEVVKNPEGVFSAIEAALG